jgi:serine/threonine protein kinase
LDPVAAPPPKIQLAELAAKTKAEARLGTIVSGRYRLTEVLAMGGVGVVYKGEHVHMRKKVAIKLLHPDAEGAPDLVARFQREAVAGAHIQHPNVTAATDFGELDDGSFFLVLEYVRGTTLREIINRGPLPAKRAVHIGKQLAAALAATHAIGIVHRDVTPRNVMVVEGERDQVKLIDFGLARLDAAGLAKADAIHHSDHDIRITGTGAVFGTIAYLAPEVVRGMDLIDARADLYALGIVFYEMLSGKHPFDTTDAVELFKRHAMTRPSPIAERTPGVAVPPPLEAIVFRLLEKAPEDRFPSADALIAALDADLEGMLTPSTPPPVTTNGQDAARPSLTPPPPSAPSAPERPSFAPPPRASFPPPLPRPSAPPPAPSAPPPRASAPPLAQSTPLPAAAPLSIPPAPLLPRISVPPPPPTAARLPQPSLPSVASARIHPAPIDPPLDLAPDLAPARSPRRPLLAALALTVAAFGALALLWTLRGGDAPASTASTPEASAASLSLHTTPPSALAAAASAPLPRPPSALPLASTAAPPSATAAAALPEAPDAASRTLLRTAVSTHDYLRAIPAFRALAEHDTAAFRDPLVATAARDLAVVLAAISNPETEAIYGALATQLGEAGVDILYEIVRTRGGTKASTRATALLEKPEILARAPASARISYEYARALCPDKLTLLERCKAEGDVRTVMAMEASAKTCFNQNQALDDAMRTLRQRLSARPTP